MVDTVTLAKPPLNKCLYWCLAPKYLHLKALAKWQSYMQLIIWYGTKNGITCAAMPSLDNHFCKSRISIPTKLSCITLVSYQSFYTDLNTGQSPRWMHAGLKFLASGAWERCLESNGTNLFTMMRWGSQVLSIFGHIARMDNDADDQDDSNGYPTK